MIMLETIDIWYLLRMKSTTIGKIWYINELFKLSLQDQRWYILIHYLELQVSKVKSEYTH